MNEHFKCGFIIANCGKRFPAIFLLCGRVVLQDDVFAVSYQPLSQAFGFGHWQVITFLFYQNAFVIFISRTYHSNGHSQNMKRNIIKIIAYSLFVFALIILFKIFYPRRHSVPIFQKRNSTQYWNLLNGSKIGYTLISASGQKKSFPIIYLHQVRADILQTMILKYLDPLQTAITMFTFMTKQAVDNRNGWPT